MTAETPLANPALDERLGWLRELAGSLECAKSAVLRSDLADLNRQTLRQRELCALLGQSFLATPTGPDKRLQRITQESRKMELRVAQLNREYGALLARARRTVDIFCRLLAHSQVTYPPPKHAAAIFQPGPGA